MSFDFAGLEEFLVERSVRFLPVVKGDAPKPTVFRLLSDPEPKSDYEHAGRAYHRRLGLMPEEEEEEEEDETNEKVDPRFDMPWSVFKDAKIDLEDKYALLNLSKKEVLSTNEDITMAYRKASMVCHPDKYSSETRDHAEKRFKSMQRAYDNLIDGTKRKEYDSSIPFDDELPKKDEGVGEKFFEVYGEAFKVNARFSVNRKFPDFGDADTPYETVDKFYDFWFSFQSWRSFAHLNEHNVESAQSREERRWMERENAKKQSSAKKEEAARVRKLVEDAFAKDPRVIKRKEEEKKARDAKKNAKLEAKRKIEEEKRKAEEEAKRIEEEKAQKEAEEKARSKKRNKLAGGYRKVIRATCRSGVLGDISESTADELIEHSTFDELAVIAKHLTPDAENPLQRLTQEQADAGPKDFFAGELERVKRAKEDLKRRAEEEVAAKKLAKKLEEEKRNNAKEWSQAEKAALTRAVSKYPPGTQRRWEVITEAVNQVGDRDLKEVIAYAKDFENRAGESKTDAFEVYKLKTGLPVDEKPKEPEKTPAELAAEEAERLRKEDIKRNKGMSENWDAKTQQCFENALKKVDKDAEDRWAQIAKRVPGKTRKQCVTRFKEIRARILKAKERKAKKEAAASK